MNSFSSRKYLFVFLSLFVSLGYMARTRPRDPPTWTPSAGCPTNITATIPGWNPHTLPSGCYDFPTTQAIHDALTHCSDLESLNLRITLRGCSEWPDRWNLPLTLAGGEAYAPLKHLSLEGYRFDDSEWHEVGPPESWWDFGEWSWWVQSGRAWRWWEYRKLPIEQRNKTNLDLWLDAMKFEHLETLELRTRDYVPESFREKVTPRLNALKELTLYSYPDCSATAAWIGRLKPLKSLTWINGFNTDADSMEAVLSSHGKTIKRIELRYPEGLGSRRPTLSTVQLGQIGDMAPSLKSLSVDVSRNGTWPLEELQAIASISSLEHADVWLEYASDLAREEYSQGKHEWEMSHLHKNDTLLLQKPLLNKKAANELWEVMRSKAGERLKEVIFYAGDWSRPWDGPLYARNWLEQRKERWYCSEEGCFEKWEDYSGDYDDSEEREKIQAQIDEEDEEEERE